MIGSCDFSQALDASLRYNDSDLTYEGAQRLEGALCPNGKSWIRSVGISLCRDFQHAIPPIEIEKFHWKIGNGRIWFGFWGRIWVPRSYRLRLGRALRTCYRTMKTRPCRRLQSRGTPEIRSLFKSFSRDVANCGPVFYDTWPVPAPELNAWIVVCSTPCACHTLRIFLTRDCYICSKVSPTA